MTRDLALLLPEITVAVAALLGLMVMLTRETPRTAERFTWIAAALALGLTLVISVRLQAGGALLLGSFHDDSFARLIKVLLLLTGATLALIALRSLDGLGLMKPDLPILLALAALGGMVIASAGDLLILALGLEILSAALYALSRTRLGPAPQVRPWRGYRDSLLATCVTLLGIAVIAGSGGASNLDALAGGLSQGLGASSSGELPFGVLAGLALYVTGILAKFSVGPLQLWQPETGRERPVVVVAMLDLLPKIALVAVLARLLFTGLDPLSTIWQPILASLALVAVVFGALAALMQTELKGLLAQTGLAQLGLILIGLAAGGPEGLLAAMLALVLYTALQTGGYAFAATLTSDGRPMTALSALVGYVSHAPARTLAVLLILLGLSGAPPLVGYAAKIALLFAASSGGWLWLAIAAFAAFLACVAVYLRLAIQLASGEDEEILDTRFDVLPVAIVMVAASVSVIGAFTLLGLDDLAWQAAESLAR
ncbi:MAG: proton-conducting transporter membrane subunit [Pseudomonadota bacterium]